MEIQKIILKKYMKGRNKCSIHGDRIFQKLQIQKQSYQQNLLINPKCRYCKKIGEEFLALKQKYFSQNQDDKNKTEENQTLKINQSFNFPIYSYSGDKGKGNFSDLLRTSILQNQYFKSLVESKFEDLLEEVKDKVEQCSPWIIGANGVPSTLFCILYRLVQIKPTEKQVTKLIKFKANPYIKCLGFLFIRYCSPPDQLWLRLSPYIFDEHEF